MMLTVIIFVVILGLLVFVHELGHFLVAKRNGVKVEEFGFGFPPRILGIKRGETIYSVNTIPLGGFVKIYGEDGEGEKNSRSFTVKNAWQKTAILLAGVAMNFALAVILFGLGHFIGLPTAVDESEIQKYPDAKVQIVGLAVDSPALVAGLKTGDFVVALKNLQGQTLEPVKKISQFQAFVEEEKGEQMTLVAERGDSKIEILVTARINPPAGQGPLGVELASVAKIRLPWYEALAQGFLTTISLVWLMLTTLFEIVRGLFVGVKPAIDVVGPVGIFNLTGQAAAMGFIYLLQLTAILSINLAVINAFPFPALDGGRVLFLLIEKIKGSPFNEKVLKTVNTIGFALLIALMMFITFRDITKIF